MQPMTSRQIFLQGMRLSPESRLLEQVALLSPASHQLNSKIVIVAMDLPNVLLQVPIWSAMMEQEWKPGLVQQ